ncbi:hypothetical protein [Streptomyces sp. AC495_CC817]|uniref:hypothetical protein n=1 Tax=Streptomyces sp. AC495_CC817 TaxID=2823900 RepID=UPI001C25A247|nr:hypothetical protein [Streptomyces sp. AC495_CC817]
MRMMWFGTKRFSRWIKVHSPGSGYVMGSYSESLAFLNGLTALRSSTNGHMEYAPTWSRLTQEGAEQISNFASGLYGDGPFYLVDPVAMKRNALNMAWSAPGIATKDGVPIAGNSRPELVSNPDQSREYPADMAKYTLTATDTSRSFYLPIPPGFVAHIGAHGDPASTLRLRVQPTVGGVAAGAATNVPVLSVSTSTRFNHTVSGGNQTGIEISIQTGTAGFITLAGIMVQLHPALTPPAGAGNFIAGQGSTGLSFDGLPRSTPYSLAHDAFGLSVKLVETEDAR